jgi:hypothetical protein
MSRGMFSLPLCLGFGLPPHDSVSLVSNCRVASAGQDIAKHAGKWSRVWGLGFRAAGQDVAKHAEKWSRVWGLGFRV